MNRAEPISLEICINAQDAQATECSVRAAYHGGADRIELCSRMDVQGLTPSLESIKAARRAFGSRHVLVMIRPRAGDFDYALAEVEKMCRDIESAAAAGADGVVLGAVKNGSVDQSALHRLLSIARANHQAVTFHRAFDALADTIKAVELLADGGVRRVLTAGEPWGATKTIRERRQKLVETVSQSQGRFEVVIAGGVNAENVGELLTELPLEAFVSVHAYSSVLSGGTTDQSHVRALRAALDSI